MSGQAGAIAIDKSYKPSRFARSRGARHNTAGYRERPFAGSDYYISLSLCRFDVTSGCRHMSLTAAELLELPNRSVSG